MRQNVEYELPSHTPSMELGSAVVPGSGAGQQSAQSQPNDVAVFKHRPLHGAINQLDRVQCTAILVLL